MVRGGARVSWLRRWYAFSEVTAEKEGRERLSLLYWKSCTIKTTKNNVPDTRIVIGKGGPPYFLKNPCLLKRLSTWVENLYETVEASFDSYTYTINMYNYIVIIIIIVYLIFDYYIYCFERIEFLRFWIFSIYPYLLYIYTIIIHNNIYNYIYIYIQSLNLLFRESRIIIYIYI